MRVIKYESKAAKNGVYYEVEDTGIKAESISDLHIIVGRIVKALGRKPVSAKLVYKDKRKKK